MKTTPFLLTSAVALGLLSACVAPDPYPRRQPPPPPAVYYQPLPPGPQPLVIVEQEPPPLPPPQPQIIIAQPGPNVVWIDGYWSWQGQSRSYVWIGGRWEHPPRRGARWAGAHWERRGGGSVFIEGTWR